MVFVVLGAVLFLLIGFIELGKSGGLDVLGSMWFYLLIAIIAVPLIFRGSRMFALPLAVGAFSFALAALFLYAGNGYHLSILFG